MQTGCEKSMMRVISNTYKNEGLLAFYAGMSSPFCTVPLVNAITWSSYEFFKRFTKINEGEELSMKQGVLAGMFVGSVISWIIGPVELLKCRIQVQD